MISFEEYRKLALSLPEAVELPHFEKPSFRFRDKIFATYWTKEHLAMVKLPLAEQSVFCAFDNTIFYPVNGGWGLKGATLVNLAKVRKDMFKDALQCAYHSVSKPAVRKR